MQKKTFIYVLVLMLVMLGISWGVWSILSDREAQLKTNQAAKEVFGEEALSAKSEKKKKTEADSSQKKNAEAELPTEKAFRQTIHAMTHQKIVAEDKWSHVQITEKRISSLLDIAERSEYRDKEYYLTELKKWEQGNFENSVELHNHVWIKLGGTVGKAEKLMTEKQEKKYIEEHFE